MNGRRLVYITVQTVWPRDRLCDYNPLGRNAPHHQGSFSQVLGRCCETKRIPTVMPFSFSSGRKGSVLLRKKREREKRTRFGATDSAQNSVLPFLMKATTTRERESKVYSINGQKSHHLADSMMEYNWSFSFNRARVCVSMRLFFHLSIHSIRAVRSSFYAFLRRSAAERNDSKSPLAHLLLLLRPFLVTSGNFDHW